MQRNATRRCPGFTFIELLIYLATLSIVLAGLHSWLANHSIRMKIAEAVSAADSTKTSISISCTEDPGIPELKSSLVGNQLPTSSYVADISLDGSCAAPVIIVATTNTGLLVDPTLTISGVTSGNGVHFQWLCHSDGLDVHVPENCRG